jgi:lysophospholipase L1-like esterase
VHPFSAAQNTLNDGIKATAAQFNLKVADLEATFLVGCQSDYTVDGVHPNGSGHQQMHDLIAPLL